MGKLWTRFSALEVSYSPKPHPILLVKDLNVHLHFKNHRVRAYTHGGGLNLCLEYAGVTNLFMLGVWIVYVSL